MNLAWMAASVAAGALGLAGGAAAGLVAARRYAVPRWRLWALNAGALVGCSALCALGLALGERWLAIGALALLAGALTGLKYGARGGFLGRPPEADEHASE